MKATCKRCGRPHRRTWEYACAAATFGSDDLEGARDVAKRRRVFYANNGEGAAGWTTELGLRSVRFNGQRAIVRVVVTRRLAPCPPLTGLDAIGNAAVNAVAGLLP